MVRKIKRNKARLVFPSDSILKSNKSVKIVGWKKLNHEWRGTRDKVVVIHPQSGVPFLVKKPKYGDSEILIELFNSYLAKSLGLSTSDCFLCIHKGELSFASKSFIYPLDGSCELWEMRELLCYYTSSDAEIENKFGRDSNVLKEHNIDNLFQIIEEEFGSEVLPPFFKMIAFDCLIGHGDRHWENYGFLIKQNPKQNKVQFKFAPLYDTAYSFLIGNSEEKIKTFIDSGELLTPEWHRPKLKGISKITVPGNIKSNHFDLLEHILGNTTFSKYHRYIIDFINSYDKVIAQMLLKREPFKSRLSETRKTAIELILETRIDLMKKIIG